MTCASSIDYEIVIVEDSSPDGTQEVAEHLRDVYGSDRIKILSRAGKLGLGSAYQDGLQLADGDFVIILDADMSHHVRSWGGHWRGGRGGGQRACVCVCVCVWCRGGVKPLTHLTGMRCCTCSPSSSRR